jgi:hypothetical protein
MVQQNPPHEQSIHECISIVHYSSMHAFDSTCIVYTLGVYYLCGWSCCWWKKKTRFSVTTLTSDYHAIDDCTSIVLYKLLFFDVCPQWFIHCIRLIICYNCNPSIMHHIKSCYWSMMHFDKCDPSLLQIMYATKWRCMLHLVSTHDTFTAFDFNTFYLSIHTV